MTVMKTTRILALVVLCIGLVVASPPPVYAATLVGNWSGFTADHSGPWGPLQLAPSIYNVFANNAHADSPQVWLVSPEVYEFYDSSTGWEYTNSVGGVCGAWLCDDAGAPQNNSTANSEYIVHCLPNHPGGFSLWSAQTHMWAQEVELPNGQFGPEFTDPNDPILGSIQWTGIYIATIAGHPGAWCGA